LLAALLMYSTLSGILPKALHAGKPASIVLGLLLLGFALYHFSPELVALWHSEGVELPSSHSAPRPAAAPAPESRETKPVRQAATRWKTTVVGDSVPAASERQPEPAGTTPAEKTAPSEPSSDDSPYDSGSSARRGVLVVFCMSAERSNRLGYRL